MFQDKLIANDGTKLEDIKVGDKVIYEGREYVCSGKTTMTEKEEIGG